MKNKIKYILSALLVIGATAAMVLAPDVMLFSADTNMRSEVYKSEANPMFSPVEPSQVAEVFAEGKFINRYDYYDSDTKEIRRLSLAAAEDFFKSDSETAELIKNMMSGEDITYERVNSVIAVVDDRMVVMEFVTVSFLSEVEITFEKNTLTVLSLRCALPADFAEEKIKYAGGCAVNYVTSYLKDTDVTYGVYGFEDGKGHIVWEFILTNSQEKDVINGEYVGY